MADAWKFSTYCPGNPLQSTASDVFSILLHHLQPHHTRPPGHSAPRKSPLVLGNPPGPEPMLSRQFPKFPCRVHKVTWPRIYHSRPLRGDFNLEESNSTMRQCQALRENMLAGMGEGGKRGHLSEAAAAIMEAGRRSVPCSESAKESPVVGQPGRRASTGAIHG